MFLKFAVKRKCKKAGVDDPEFLAVAVDYQKKVGEISIGGKTSKGLDLQKNTSFTTDSAEADELKETLLGILKKKKEYKEIHSAVVYFDLKNSVLSSQVFFVDSAGLLKKDTTINKI